VKHDEIASAPTQKPTSAVTRKLQHSEARAAHCFNATAACNDFQLRPPPSCLARVTGGQRAATDTSKPAGVLSVSVLAHPSPHSAGRECVRHIGAHAAASFGHSKAYSQALRGVAETLVPQCWHRSAALTCGASRPAAAPQSPQMLPRTPSQTRHAAAVYHRNLIMHASNSAY